MLAGHQRETECSPNGGKSAPQVSTYVQGFTAVGAKGDEPVQEVGAGRAERQRCVGSGAWKGLGTYPSLGKNVCEWVRATKQMFGGAKGEDVRRGPPQDYGAGGAQ